MPKLKSNISKLISDYKHGKIFLSRLPFSPEIEEESGLIETLADLEDYRMHGSDEEDDEDEDDVANYEKKITSIIESSEMLRKLGMKGQSAFLRHLGFTAIFWNHSNVIPRPLVGELEKSGYRRDEIAEVSTCQGEPGYFKVPARLFKRSDKHEAVAELEKFIIAKVAEENADPGFLENGEDQDKAPEVQAYNKYAVTSVVLDGDRVIAHLRWFVHEWHRNLFLEGEDRSRYPICPRVQNYGAIEIERLSKRLYELECEEKESA